MLAKEGVHVPASDLFGVAGRRLLDEVPLGRAYTIRVESPCDLIALYDRVVTMADRKVRTALDGHHGWAAVQTIRGVGLVLGAVFVAEIGEVGRFPTARHLCSRAGLHAPERHRRYGRARGADRAPGEQGLRADRRRHGPARRAPWRGVSKHPCGRRSIAATNYRREVRLEWSAWTAEVRQPERRRARSTMSSTWCAVEAAPGGRGRFSWVSMSHAGRPVRAATKSSTVT